MFMYVFSIVLIIVSNVLYHICQKSLPQGSNPFSVLFIVYITAAVISVVGYYLYNPERSLFQSLKELNWATIVIGITIVGIEFGYLMAYRAGWNISQGSLIANIALAVMLIPIGILFFKEGFDLNKLLGSVFCIIGLILINK